MGYEPATEINWIELNPGKTAVNDAVNYFFLNEKVCLRFAIIVYKWHSSAIFICKNHKLCAIISGIQ